MESGAGKHLQAVWAFAVSGLELDEHTLPTSPDGVDTCLDRLAQGGEIVRRFESLAGPDNPLPTGLKAVEFRDAHVCLLAQRLRHDADCVLGRTRLATALKRLTRRRIRERELRDLPWWEVPTRTGSMERLQTMEVLDA